MAETAEKLRNITPFDEIVLEIDSLYDEAKNWADGADIETEEQHEAAKTIYDALHEAGKKADGLRKQEKQPLDDQIKAIQDRYNPYIQPKKGKVDIGKDALNAVLAKWRKKVAEERERIAAEERRKAEEKAKAAQEAMRTSTGNLEAREEAERLLAEAKKQEKSASKAEKASTTGLGLRTYWIAEMTDPRAAVAAMWKRDPQAFVDLAQDLASKAARSGVREIDGFTIREEKVAV